MNHTHDHHGPGRGRLVAVSLMALASAMWSADPLPPGNGTGLAAGYYVNQAHSVGDISGSPVLTRTDAGINFDWGQGSPDAGIPGNFFAAIWNGMLEPRVTGIYTIHVTSDNNQRVWINGQAITEHWVVNKADTKVTYSGTIALVAGQKVPIRVDYCENLGQAGIVLEWQAADQPREVIPASQLYPEPLPSVKTGPGTGLLAGYFPAPSFTGTPVIRTDAVVDFDWPSVPLDGFPSEYFSVRWQGRIIPPLAEPTTLLVTVYSGMRLWMDGALVIDAWTHDKSTLTYRYALPVGAGIAHDMRLEYAANHAAGMVKLEWEGQHTPRQAVAANQLIPANALLTPGPSNGTGLTATYFANQTLSGVALRRRDPTINFAWGHGSPDGSIPVDHFSARWSGRLQTRFDETYTLMVTAYHGTRLWLDDVLVMDGWNATTAKARGYTFSHAFPAKAGQKYNLRMEYYQNSGAASAILEWDSPSEGRQVVPEACLYPNDLDVDMPTASKVSPAFIEGLHGNGLTVNASAGAVTMLGGSRFCVNVPLAVAVPTAVSLCAGGGTATGAVAWTPTPLSGSQNLVVRPGDSLLFQAVVAGTWGVGLNCGPFRNPASINAGDLVPVRFDAPGFYQLNEVDALGAQVATITVDVPQVLTAGPVPVAVNYVRNKDVAFAAVKDASIVSWTVADQWLTLGSAALPAGSPATSRRLTVSAGLNRSTLMMARVNGVSGPILASFPVRPFIMRSDSEKYIKVERAFSDGSLLCNTAVIMEPLVGGLQIKLFACVAGVTFDDSTTIRWLTSGSFTENAGNGIYPFKLIRPPGINTGVCHAWIAYDHGAIISP